MLRQFVRNISTKELHRHLLVPMKETLKQGIQVIFVPPQEQAIISTQTSPPRRCYTTLFLLGDDLLLPPTNVRKRSTRSFRSMPHTFTGLGIVRQQPVLPHRRCTRRNMSVRRWQAKRGIDEAQARIEAVSYRRPQPCIKPLDGWASG